MTLTTLAEICHALECKPLIRIKEQKEHAAFEGRLKIEQI
jgi:DNA-binding Xre family transcriptional regulator